MLGIRCEYLLLVGQNQPSKGHEVALRALARAGVSNLCLVFVQRRNVANGLLGLARDLGVVHRVRFLSEVPRPELVSLMQGAVALLQPSSDEGFGLPALEAAACGCPVLASDVPVLREVLGDAALYVPARDVSAWSSAIIEISANVQLSDKLRLRGPERAANFTWDKTAERTLQVYRDALRAS
jgi:glycosyltransferase involved in cell wall biosynthesis